MSSPASTILELQERFATEEACREYLFASRWPEGSRARAGFGCGTRAAYLATPRISAKQLPRQLGLSR